MRQYAYVRSRYTSPPVSCAALFLSSVEWKNVALEVSEAEEYGLLRSHECMKQLRALEHPPLRVHDVPVSRS